MATSNSVQQTGDPSVGRSLALCLTILVVFVFALVGASIGYVFSLIAAMPNAERAYWAQAFAGLLGAAATTYAVYFAANANERLRRAESRERDLNRAKHASILCGLFQEELFDSACRLYDAELYFAEVFEPLILDDIVHRWADIKIPVLQKSVSGIDVFDVADGILFGKAAIRLRGVQLMGELNKGKVDHWAPDLRVALWKAAKPVIEQAKAKTIDAYKRAITLSGGSDQLDAAFQRVEQEHSQIRSYFLRNAVLRQEGLRNDAVANQGYEGSNGSL